ncbi:MAG: hypothetical protein ACRDIU_04090, partial [Actinomycetota bacterium]
GLLEELPESSPADYRFSHEQVKEFAAASLSSAQRRRTHQAIVDMLTAEGEPLPESLPLLAQHAMAAGDTARAAHFSVEAAKAALAARAPEEVLRLVDAALAGSSGPIDRVALLTARDDALEMLGRPGDRLEGLAELEALSEAMGDSHLELEIMLRRASALRLAGETDLAAGLAQQVKQLAIERRDRKAELAALLETGQALLGVPAGESFSPTASETDLDGADAAYSETVKLAEEIGDNRALAVALRELGVVRVGQVRKWYVGQVASGEIAPLMKELSKGVSLGDILPGLPIAPLVGDAMSFYERAAELFEKIGDRRGVMTAVIGMAFLKFGVDIHMLGSARRIEEIRRLSTSLASLSRESQRSFSEVAMLYGAHVFARAKGVYDLALSRGESAWKAARVQGDRSLEFAAAGGMALVHIDLGETTEAKRWVDTAAMAAAAEPTPLKSRRLEMYRGLLQAAEGDAVGTRAHFEQASAMAAEQNRLPDRCEALARLSLEAARLGAESASAELLGLARRCAAEVQQLAPSLPGRPVWPIQAHAAMASILLAEGDASAAAAEGGAALEALEAVVREDLHLEIVLPAAEATFAGGTAEMKEKVLDGLRVALAQLVQRIVDEDVRIRWFKSPLGKKLSTLAAAGSTNGQMETAAPVAGPDITDEESRLLWFLIEGRSNREIAEELGIDQEILIGRLARVYGKIGVTSPAGAAMLALREGVV